MSTIWQHEPFLSLQRIVEILLPSTIVGVLDHGLQLGFLESAGAFVVRVPFFFNIVVFKERPRDPAHGEGTDQCSSDKEGEFLFEEGTCALRIAMFHLGCFQSASVFNLR